MPIELDNFLNTAIEAAREAGRIQRERFGEDFKIEHKGEINLVTEVDYQCEKAIIDIIKRDYPEHEILTEESGSIQKPSPLVGEGRGEGKYKWIIDPLYGSTNHGPGFPCDIRHSKENNLNHFCNFAVRAQAIRRPVSAAFSLKWETPSISSKSEIPNSKQCQKF